MTSVVIGVGNHYRRDDGAGLVAAEKLCALNLAGVKVVESDGEPAGVLLAWEGATVAVIIDAVRTGTAPAGTVYRAESPTHLPPARECSGSTHAMGVGAAFALGDALGRLPHRLVIYGVEAESFAAGTCLSANVAAAVEVVVAAVAAELSHPLPLP